MIRVDLWDHDHNILGSVSFVRRANAIAYVRDGFGGGMFRSQIDGDPYEVRFINANCVVQATLTGDAEDPDWHEQ